MKYDLEKSINEVEFVVFDVETTGLNDDRDNIIEIGAIKSTRDHVLSEFSSFIDIAQPILPEVTAVNGITQDMIHGAPLVNEVLRDFLEFFDDAVLVAHNISFDYGFLNAELIRNNFNGLENCFLVDTLVLSRKAFPGLSSYKLEFLANQLNINASRFHRALDDAITCRELLFRCCDELSMLGELALSEIVI